MFNLIPDPVVIVDGESGILAVNNKVEDKTGFKRDELVGRNFLRTKIVTEKSKVILIENLAKRVMGVHVAPYEVEVLTKDGRKGTAELNAAGIEYEGKPADLVMFRDVTERRKMEEALRKSEEKYESLVELALDAIVTMDLEGAMNKIVSDLQDYTRPLKPELAETNLRELINEKVSTIVFPKGVRLSIMIEESFSKLMVDPAMMKRVFANLVVNALQAMPNGGQLTIRAFPSKTEEVAFIKIEDTGTGMSEENLEKLFQPLFTTKPKGTGLGLAVCKRPVEAHDGNITVKSHVGKGSTFTVKVPIGGR